MWIFCLLWILVMWIILYHLFIHILLSKICSEGSNYMDWHTIWYYESFAHRRWKIVYNPDTFEIFVTEWFCKNIFKLCIILNIQTCTIHSISLSCLHKWKSYNFWRERKSHVQDPENCSMLSCIYWQIEIKSNLFICHIEILTLFHYLWLKKLI